MAKRRDERIALCVGINNYPQPYTLNGCAPDARSMGKTLSEDAKYEASVMVDNEATKREIEGELLRMVRATKAPGNIIFYQSSHGTNLRDINGDERDGRDEALVPVDFLEGNFILDDDIFNICSQRNPGVGITIIADTCYSGTISRVAPSRGPSLEGSFTGLRARYLNPLVFEQYSRIIPVYAVAPREDREINWVEITACDSTQLSYESFDAVTGETRGHFTKTFEYVLRHSVPNRPLTSIIADVRAILEPGQTPTLTIPSSFSKRTTLVTNPKT